MNIQWDAEKYTADFSFVHQYGSGVAELIDGERGAKVLDLGCGNGALSKALRDRGYVVTGLDASKELLEIARTNYPDIPFIQGDATDFSLPEPVDVVFSNAVLHWIDREWQGALLRCVYRALRDRGQFVFEMGGCGNNRRRPLPGGAIPTRCPSTSPPSGSTPASWRPRAFRCAALSSLTGQRSSRGRLAWRTGSACLSRLPSPS